MKTVTLSEKQNCYYRPDEGCVESDFRCTPEKVFVISLDALRYKRQHWHEFAGVADGCCDVTDHVEWRAIYNWLLTNHLPAYYADKVTDKFGPNYLICCELSDGKTAFVGSISRNNGRLSIGG
jgi:hypothetical protein